MPSQNILEPLQLCHIYEEQSPYEHIQEDHLVLSWYIDINIQQTPEISPCIEGQSLLSIWHMNHQVSIQWPSQSPSLLDHPLQGLWKSFLWENKPQCSWDSGKSLYLSIQLPSALSKGIDMIPESGFNSIALLKLSKAFWYCPSPCKAFFFEYGLWSIQGLMKWLDCSSQELLGSVLLREKCRLGWDILHSFPFYLKKLNFQLR